MRGRVRAIETTTARTSLGWRGCVSCWARRDAPLLAAWSTLVAARSVGSVGGARTRARELSVTFDDGPDPAVTPRVLDALERTGTGATFFVLSDRVREHPYLVPAILDAGHEVALHGDDHERLTTLPLEVVRSRMTEAADIVQQHTGRPLRWFRPPFGAQDRAIRQVLLDLGMESVVWGPTAFDWEEGTPEEVAARGLADLAPGAVLLLHDGLSLPPGQEPPGFDRGEAHSLLLDRLVAQGWTGRSVGDLVTRHPMRRTVWFRP